MSGPPRKPEGIVFPITDEASGERSSTVTSKNIWADATRPIDGELAESILKERSWRYKYDRYILKHVQASLKTPDAPVKAAQAGLEALHNSFEFVRGDTTYTLAEAMGAIKGTFETGKVIGKNKGKGKPTFEIPYKGKSLKGDSIVKQVQQWAKYGTIEPDTAEAIIKVAQNNDWVDLSDKYFVLLGAGSAMGPFLVLMALGANVVAVDLDRPGIWERLIGIAENSSGTLTFPLKKPQNELNGKELFENAGSNLITQAPEINNWLQTVYPKEDLTVGCYVYLDGEAHVRVALACDAIIKGLTESRRTGVAYLCTPTDAHVIPKDANVAAAKNYSSLSLNNLLVLPIRTLFGSKYLVKNALRPVKGDNGSDYYYVDGLVVAQGPNYALAKRMQHWRAVVAREVCGCVVSSNVAPSTATASVVHNRQFAWAYDGMPFFRPMEIFQQETSNAVMGALLIHDVRNPDSASNPKGKSKLTNPLELFSRTSFHGGVWRCAYKIGTIGEVSVLIHFFKVLRPVLILSFLVVLGAIVYKAFL